ncbi:aspartyl protease family protein [Rubricoccus marinus]|uniref:Amidohydrolase-related domain-containing protein n=1 Tax=Rubricoccus marinus TaxID=716817 RepID=A0A259TY53_9BACT|nr:aspartyl protease family protein [Rubricoccus marinus]OZC02705.1 hypothetical protein BSZ36_06780 [Rubricoccus marinus]
MRSALVAAVLLFAAAPLAPTAAQTAYVGGRWFTGERFAPRDTVWASGGVFTSRPLAPEAARVVDLDGRYIVPPFGDAHTHMLADSYSAGLAHELFVDRGVLYALVLNDDARGGPRGDLPAGLDVALAHGGITSTGSHPAPLYERLARNPNAASGAARSDTLAWTAHRRAYWFFDTPAIVEQEWADFLATEPDAVKVYLTYNARCDGRPTYRGCGLSPQALHEVVRRSREAGLPVVAHVNTRDDVRRAVEAGVDALAHLPSGNDGIGTADPRFWLDAETVARMASGGVTAIPTASLLMKDLDAFRADTLQTEVARQRAELQALHAAGVPLALGADQWRRSAAFEADYLAAAGVFEPAVLLDLWSRVTPQTVLPDREIGRLAPGYEASFLALACDPLADWTCTRRITHLEKQGVALRSSPEASGDPAETVRLWREVDLAAFTAPPEASDGPLRAGLKALVDADFDGAARRLTEALDAVPDSLRPFVHSRIGDAAAARFDWDAALGAWKASGDDVEGGTVAGWARFPGASVRFSAPEATVPFDHLRVPAAVNGEAVRAIVDTGGPNTSVSRGLAQRLGLRVDSTARGFSYVPSAGTTTPNYAVLIDSVQVGAATFYNVPATVSWTDDASGEAVEPGEETIFLGAMLLRRFAGAIRYNYADSTFTIVRDVPRTDARPNSIIEGQLAPAIAATVNGSRAKALVDTGSSTDVYLASGEFEIPPEAYTRTISGTLASGYTWTQRLYALPFEIDGHPASTLEAYEASYILNADSPVTVLLGKTVWREGTLTIDFVNRRVSYAPAFR